ncbi:unnamed protein product [Cylindrotheca closterium]|uniref:Uncharacterized protein n=1 Tax=Cylindrotheca closterium TaxID=2856 RepID=A0AAD2FF89_9STRA|nr:unnamed protein product [Cylindrotheca closterium]
MPSPNKPEGSGPSIKLKVRSTSPVPSSSTSATAIKSSSSSPKPNAEPSSNEPGASKSKKRRFNPPPSLQDNKAEASNLRLYHQKSHLSFVLHSNYPPTTLGNSGGAGEPKWYAQGQTTLYLADLSMGAASKSSSLNLALHLRGSSCQVTHVQVEGVNERNYSFAPLKSAHWHFDPLAKVLRKPPTSYTMEDIILQAKQQQQPRHEADSQCSRGAKGMTTSLRAASIASHLGELRISAAQSNQPAQVAVQQQQQDKLAACWKQDLQEPPPHTTAAHGKALERIQGKMASREGPRKQARVDLVAKDMAKQRSSVKVTVHYLILLGKEHLGGIHALARGGSPHIYTTSGVYGDHEGPRSWIPTLDSAATHHRASHDLTIQVTAPMREGLSVVGFGEDCGGSKTYLHRRPAPESPPDVQLQQELGYHHVRMLHRIINANHQTIMTQSPNAPHVIPPDPSSASVVSIDSLLATTVWTSASWLPVSARALGFAIGPFRMLEDPEFFHDSTLDDKSPEAKQWREEAEEARQNGEGIRQYYFAPIFARKYIHAQASTSFLPNTDFQFSPLTPRQKDIMAGLDQSVILATAGVTNRALSFMKEILALPVFRTVAYSQVWIPGAVHGGSTSGCLNGCPEASLNPFLGGAIMDSRLLPPVGHRLPFYHGGRALQFLQARSAVRGWIISAIPLGGQDDVGQGYIHALFESLIMSLYERGHAAHGEGGAKDSMFYTKRFSGGSGLNSNSLDFFPIQNIEDADLDVVVGGIIGAVPVEDRNNDQLWRSASNGSESHTSSMDEFAIRQLLCKDAVNHLERMVGSGRTITLPSMGWLGSSLALSFLSSNATSSAGLGCGALELAHPVGGLPYRALKSDLLRKVIEGRAGIANFIRLVRASFVAAHLDDNGHQSLNYPPNSKPRSSEKEKPVSEGEKRDMKFEESQKRVPRFINCVNEILKKRGLTHTLFTRALQNLAGKIREAQLLGTLVDVERTAIDPRTKGPFVEPAGFPNIYVRGASEFYLRVGVHVEPARDGPGGVNKGIQLQSYAEPVIPVGGVALGGAITVRVVENEGSFREFVKDINVDGSRRDWGSLFLHAKPVTLPKAQTAASGIIETTGSSVKDPSNASSSLVASSGGAFSESHLHRGGYQAIELIRLTNLTPLLWVRVDPMGLYGGKISVSQPDACLAEMVFHDGDAGAQVTAMRALAERPVRIQGSLKVTAVYDVNIAELPVRVLGDCLRGSPAMHSSLPHTPGVRVQAALAIGQWQNNKAPQTKNTTGAKHWIGLNLLIQYFKERFINNGTPLPVKMNRVVLKKNSDTSEAAANQDGASKKSNDEYDYLDSFDEGEERAAVLEEFEEVEVEEDEEYRVRSAVITAIASVRAKDGLTPTAAIEFLEKVLDSVDTEMVGNLVSPDEELFLEKKRRKLRMAEEEAKEDMDGDKVVNDLNDGLVPSIPYASSMLISDSLLALCYINASPAVITDPVTGKPVQSTAKHPVSRLMEICRRWLDWELYRERIRMEVDMESMSGVAGVCYDSIASCAITALSSLAIQRQSTTEQQTVPATDKSQSSETSDESSRFQEAASADFYIKIFDSKPHRSDVTRAACAQAIICVCCAADRLEDASEKPTGLLFALEFVLERITDRSTSPALRQTLAQLMMDACTGRICSMQRVATIGGRNDLFSSTARFLNGPLGAANGGDNGSAILTMVTPASFPAAAAVNDGARRGLRLMTRAGREPKAYSDVLITRIARFATTLWRTMNGEPLEVVDGVPGYVDGSLGICANDGVLRCSLLCLWQWIWPNACYATLRVQSWKTLEGKQYYKDIGGEHVMKQSEEEKEGALLEEVSLKGICNLVDMEIDRQKWRSEMSSVAFDYNKNKKSADASEAEQGIGKPLPPIQRDSAFLAGGWTASAAQQRRKLALDGGMAVTKLRLRKSGD